MPSEITGLPSPSVQSHGLRGVEKTSQQGPSENTPKINAAHAPSAGTVIITDTARLLKSAESTLADIPVVNNNRVENIRNALDSGHYVINDSRVADKFMRLEQALG